MRAGWLVFWVFPVALAAACSASDNGSSAVDSSTDGSDGGGGSDGTSPGPDGTMTSDSSPGQDSPSGTDTGSPPVDTGTSGGWDGSFGGGPLACPGSVSYVQNGVGQGSCRWSVKTGTDGAASSISLIPTLTTITALSAFPNSGSTCSDTSRASPLETTTWALKDVRLIYVRLETDSDYHVVMSDGVNTMITEVPYPDYAQGSPWSCFLTRARAQIDTHYPGVANGPAGSGQGTDQVVSAIGVGYFDQEHGQNGAAPNNAELHALLALCFGQGCTPGQ